MPVYKIFDQNLNVSDIVGLNTFYSFGVSNKELGYAFYSSQAGYLTGGAYYRTEYGVGTHTIKIWDQATQLLLASAIVPNDTGENIWREAYFSTPIYITAEKNYIISVEIISSATLIRRKNGAIINGLLTAPPDQSFRSAEGGIGTFPSIQNGNTFFLVATNLVTPFFYVNDPGIASISGAPLKGQILTVEVSDLDGVPAMVSYQWQSSSNGGSTWNNIDGATDKSIFLTNSVVGQKIRSHISYTDTLGAVTSLTSSSTDPVLNVNQQGTLMVSGNAVRGQVLTAVPSDIDGLIEDIEYQWQFSLDGNTWGNISGKTDQSLLLSNLLVGSVIRATAIYTDAGGAEETLTSDATEIVANSNIAGTVSVIGPLIKGQSLTAVVTDVDGITGAITYQWQSSTDGIAWENIDNANTSSLSLITALVGKKVRTLVSYTDELGTNETLISSATDLITSDNASGTIIVAGSPTENQILTAIVTDLDGISGDITYQWQSSPDSIAWENIEGATESTLLLTIAFVEKRVRALAAYTDLDGTNESLISSMTEVIASTSVNAIGSIAIEGLAQRNETLTATIFDPAGVSGEVNYQWMAKSPEGNWNSILGANSFELLLNKSLVGKRIKVFADYIDDLGVPEYVISAETDIVTSINIQGTVTITGVPIAGATLEANTEDEDGLLDIPINYQWQSSLDGDTWEDIEGETDSTLFLILELVEQLVRVIAEYTDELGTEESITSEPTEAVIPSPDPGVVSINGSPRQYSTLSAMIEDPNGVDLSSITYQWEKSFDNIEWESIPGAISYELYLKADYQNHFIRVLVAYNTSLGNLVELTSDRTASITPPLTSLSFVEPINPYSQSSAINAVFTFESFPDWITDEETGNLIPDSDGDSVIICTATIKQKKDPNLVVQPGIDYNRVYFEGYLVSPKTLLNIEQGRNVTSVINGRQGVFDFVPVMESVEEMNLKQREVNGQRIAGYFRFT